MPTVTRKSQATRQQRREQIELQLLEATERLMGDGTSFTELSVDRLATEAGISRASFYIYFEDKGDLLRRLAGQVFGDLSTAGQRWWDMSWRHNPADVQAAMADIIASYRRHQPVLVALNEVAAYEPATAQTYRDLLGAVIERMTRVIEDGQGDGSIRRELTASTTASALVWMVERACQQNLPVKPPDYDAELAATLAEIVWGALYLKASR
ncbi:TetR/AcrR family transcriptional regulator [Mycobacterium angelicum]|uniref:TetR family transcriptional regulator n=1 Tax=Mycobacterium angelicum TaxID=470074 RepID=A0A1W9ZFI9_MYCAN|nr:TetR/AcrR family transcriptional regulator [Mycobacterium angelicum]MCV7199561.1 TetR/AcrR family transcriptional regulator [Mycobacterium angelicum]ORA14162.1 TetR family transcriptional regulator [Mycobacterium angelicum]